MPHDFEPPKRKAEEKNRVNFLLILLSFRESRQNQFKWSNPTADQRTLAVSEFMRTLQVPFKAAKFLPDAHGVGNLNGLIDKKFKNVQLKFLNLI